MKKRLDVLLVERGLAPSREKAQALILAGEVLIGRAKAAKPGQSFDEDIEISVMARPAHVSRGGLKLEAALRRFRIEVNGKVCLDIGASTGGFTDCLLQHGAPRVHAVDVGTGQLDWKIRTDPRVIVHEKLNARYLKFEDIGEFADLLVCDVSFISVTLILPAAESVLHPSSEMVILVKPQFEAGKGLVGPGGIVRDPDVHREVCDRIDRFVRGMNFQTSIMESPVPGAEGNKEFLLYAHH
jgi:23S rRNA (cytidine1920-2'-O)/16S rRNA (cytidine1409-2'-O)-methyltransferase